VSAPCVQRDRLTSPRTDSSNHKHGVENHIKRERKVDRHTGSLQKLNTLADQILTTEQLHSEGHHDNLSPSSINTPETVDVACAECRLNLEFGGMFHHGDRIGAVGIAYKSGISQSSNRLLSLFQSTFADEPPRRRRGKPDNREKRRDPHPLDDKGDSPCPVGGDG
jgi:hypothetical protein